MSDDFLSDISAAIDNGGQAVSEPVNIPSQHQQPPQQQKPQEVKPNVKEQGSVADQLSAMFDANDPNKPTEKQKEEEQKTQQQKKPEETGTNAKKPDETVKTRQQRKGQERLLDTFLKEDEKGNLVNDEGEVIALAGKSRTYYEGLKNEARKQRRAATDLAVSHMQLATQFKALYDEYKGIADNGGSPIQSIVKETGFSEPEAKEAVTLLRLYKKDPISAIKNMLTQAKMAGIDISKIGANISVDPALLKSTVTELLDERMKPLSERAEQETSREAANKEATEFLQTYPEARRFTQAIVAAKRKFPQMSLAEVWLRLRRELENRSTNQQSVTKHRRDVQQQRREPPKQRVQAPNRDYSTMSFDEIAQSIIKDNS